MTSGNIAEGAAAGDAGSPGVNSGSAALYGKNVAGGRTGRAVTIGGSSAIRNSGKAESISNSTGIQGVPLGALTASARSAAEQHAIWKEELASQSSRLTPASDPHGPAVSLDLPNSSDPVDSSVPATFLWGNPGLRPAKQSAFSASFPAGGQLSSLVKTEASEVGLAGLPHGRAGVNGDKLPSNPVAPIHASTQGSGQRIARQGSEPASKSGASTQDFHASGPSRDQALPSGYSSSNPPANLPMPASAIASMPMAFSASIASTFQAPTATATRRQDGLQTVTAHPVPETGNRGVDSALAMDSVPSSWMPAATPAAAFSLAANMSVRSSLPTELEVRNLPGGEALAGVGSRDGNTDSGAELSGFAAKLSAVREVASSTLSSLDPLTHMPDGMPSEVAFSAVDLSLSSSQEGLALTQRATNPSNLSAATQSPGVVSVTGPVSQHGASVRGGAGAGKGYASEEPATTVSASVEKDAVSLGKRAPLRTDYRLAANQGTTPGTGGYPASLSGQRAAGQVWTKSPAAQGALFHGLESAPADVSFPHFSPSEQGFAAVTTREGSFVPDSSEAGRNPFEVMDQIGQMDQATGSAGMTGPGSRVTASSAAGGMAHAIQVGYQDPVLGYVELRAHSGANGVHAFLETQSSAAGDTLTAHLGALTGWMNERRTPVESLTVSTLASQQDLSRHERDSSEHGDSAGSQARDGGFGHGSLGDGILTDRREERSSVSSVSSPRSSSVAASGIESDLAAAQSVPVLSGSSFSIVV